MSAQVKKPFMPLPTWAYVVGWFFFLYLVINIFSFQVGGSNSPVLEALYIVNFGVHELSHIVTSLLLPPVMVSAAGSIGEVLFTVVVLIVAIRFKSYFFAVFAGVWVMFAMNSTGQYMADARAQSIPLIGIGDNVMHDWNFVFGQLGWLQNDVIIGTIVRGVGDAVGIAALIFGLWLIVTKIITPKEE